MSADHNRGFEFATDGSQQPLLQELRFRPYRPGDEAQILPTFNAVFRAINPAHVDRDLAHWRWLYHANPVGTRIHLALAPDGSIAGQWAGIPVRVHTPFGERIFVQIVDTLVHPDYRKGSHDGPGVFAFVGEKGIKEWMNGHGDAALYGYPVPLAEKMGQRFLGYRHLRVVDYLCRDLTAAAPAAPPDVALDRVTALPAEVDALYAQFAATRSCLLVRDRSYLAWRYLACPGTPYEIHTARRGGALVGLMVLRPRHDLVAGSCTIAEWIVPGVDREVGDALLAAAADRGRDLGRQQLLAVFADPAPEHAEFCRRGFRIVPSAEVMERRLTYWTSPYETEVTDAFLRDGWWYSLGDSDLV